MSAYRDRSERFTRVRRSLTGRLIVACVGRAPADLANLTLTSPVDVASVDLCVGVIEGTWGEIRLLTIMDDGATQSFYKMDLEHAERLLENGRVTDENWKDELVLL